MVDRELIRVVANQLGASVVKETIASDVRRAVASPNGTYIVYYASTGLVLIDVLHNTSRVIVDGSVISCTKWSPDSRHFAVVLQDTNDLKVYNTIGKDIAAVRTPSATYEGIGEVHGDLNCGTWIDNSKFIFTRFSGSMPETLHLPGRDTIANTTTMLDIEHPDNLIDSATVSRVVDA